MIVGPTLMSHVESNNKHHISRRSDTQNNDGEGIDQEKNSEPSLQRDYINSTLKNNRHGNNYNESGNYYNNGGPFLGSSEENGPVSDKLIRIQNKLLTYSCPGLKLSVIILRHMAQLFDNQHTICMPMVVDITLVPPERMAIKDTNRQYL